MKVLSLTAGLLFFAGATFVQAHTPLCSCFDNGDGTVTCEGGFSDGRAGSDLAVLHERLPRGTVVCLREVSERTGQAIAGDIRVLAAVDPGDHATFTLAEAACTCLESGGRCNKLCRMRT